jgi:hypothetical protein
MNRCGARALSDLTDPSLILVVHRLRWRSDCRVQVRQGLDVTRTV